MSTTVSGVPSSCASNPRSATWRNGIATSRSKRRPSGGTPSSRGTSTSRSTTLRDRRRGSPCASHAAGSPPRPRGRASRRARPWHRAGVHASGLYRPAESARTHVSPRSSRRERTEWTRRVGANAVSPRSSRRERTEWRREPAGITCVRADSAPPTCVRADSAPPDLRSRRLGSGGDGDHPLGGPGEHHVQRGRPVEDSASISSGATTTIPSNSRPLVSRPVTV